MVFPELPISLSLLVNRVFVNIRNILLKSLGCLAVGAAVDGAHVRRSARNISMANGWKHHIRNKNALGFSGCVCEPASCHALNLCWCYTIPTFT